MQQGVFEYVQRMRGFGYDDGTIRTALLNSGYAPSEVDTVLRAGSAPSKRIDTKLMLYAFGALLILIVLVLVVLVVMRPEPAVLSVQVSLVSSKVTQGRDVIATVSLTNLGGAPASGLLDVVVSGPSGRVGAKTESFSVSDRTSVPVTLRIPESAALGAYTVLASVSYQGLVTSSSSAFEVVSVDVEMPSPVSSLEPSVVAEARESASECLGGCDDVNACTTDSCVAGSCVHAPVAVCCGDFVCASSESESTCAVDCGAVPDDVRSEAVAMASSNVDGAVAKCHSLGQSALVGACLSDVASIAQQVAVCREIQDDSVHDACVLRIAVSAASCDEVRNPLMKNSCLAIVNLQ